MTRKPSRAKALGVDLATYERMLTEQGGGCAICGRPPKLRRLHVDHDHKTGAVRGLLCFRCNRVLATYVSINWCLKAAAYLWRGRIVFAVGDDGWLTYTIVHGPDSEALREDPVVIP